jgi:TonB-dependent SusC/RagA subfamily outer membrane receptor
MITLAWYLLKVIICSGILCGYYFLALRNKIFHRWNRFYLLAAVVISLLAPIIKIDIFQKNEEKGTVVQMLQTISYGDEAVIEYNRNSGFQLNNENIVESAYLLICMIFLTIFVSSLLKIERLRKTFPATKIKDVSFINTNAKGTPFSFFKSIFWNDAINLHSSSGQQIFNHEVAHVKEKHSYDKIFINVVLIFFWINPFYWLMRKELYMIHEFIADKEALEDSDINAFAEMILQTVYPGQNFSITNKFFYSPIKRRILMLTKNKNPKVNYLSRLLVLPLAAIVFFAFTLKIHSVDRTNLYDGKTITVVIDAGHGGLDNGATADRWNEKDITLSLAKKIAALNSNEHINILLSRDNDQMISVKDRVLFAKEKKADLFISLHLNSSENKQSDGFSVLIDKENSRKNLLLASTLIDELKKSYKTGEKIGLRKNGVWVLDENVCPAALIEFGYLSNSADEAFITNNENQEKIAINILNAIANYAVQNSLTKAIVDTIPDMHYLNKKVTGLAVQTKTSTVKVTYDDGSTETISKEEANKRGFILPPPPPPGLPSHYFQSKALFVINGKIATSKEAKSIDPNEIKSINIIKDGEATSKYGEKGKNGVIEVTTKNKSLIFKVKADSAYDKISPETLIFVDGKEISKDGLKNIPANSIESITVLKKESGQLKYGEKGKNGVIEIITKPLNVQSDTGKQRDTIPDKVFTKVETEASFPGGPQAWVKYITRQIQASIDTFTNADYGTCVVRFIVNTDGSVSDVQATTMKGTRLAKISVNAIKTGPKWIPASQNGHTVAAYRLQPVTLTNPEKPKNNFADEKPVTFTPPVIDKVFTKIDQPAGFPGGQASWLKYISRIFEKNGNELMSDKNNLGTCKVRFIVTKDGKISDAEPITMKGTELANVAVNAIKKGPNWIPAKQNGHVVTSFVTVPVTFKLTDNIAINKEPE